LIQSLNPRRRVHDVADGAIFVALLATDVAEHHFARFEPYPCRQRRVGVRSIELVDGVENCERGLRGAQARGRIGPGAGPHGNHRIASRVGDFAAMGLHRAENRLVIVVDERSELRGRQPLGDRRITLGVRHETRAIKQLPIGARRERFLGEARDDRSRHVVAERRAHALALGRQVAMAPPNRRAEARWQLHEQRHDER
jgi:hypothetical protein